MNTNNTSHNLKLAIFLTIIILFVEVIGGYFSGSLALLSDAAHMFNDAFALFLTWFTLRLARNITTETKTFGYHRTEILAALLNSFILFYVSYQIIAEALQRFESPHEIQTGLMLGVALIGLLVNLIILFRLNGHSDLNLKSAWLHVLGDTLSSLGVIIAAILISVTGMKVLDPIISIIIAGLIMIFSTKLFKDSINILLEKVPAGISMKKVITEMKKVKKVKDVHAVHVWTICSHINVMSAHVLTDEKELCNTETMINDINQKLKKFEIKYSTLQFENKLCHSNKKLRSMKH